VGRGGGGVFQIKGFKGFRMKKLRNKEIEDLSAAGEKNKEISQLLLRNRNRNYEF